MDVSGVVGPVEAGAAGISAKRELLGLLHQEDQPDT